MPLYEEGLNILDLLEGNFVARNPEHPHFIEGKYAEMTSQLLKAMHPFELTQFKFHHDTRRALLQHYLNYYSLHISDFGQMKTLTILQEIF